MYAAMRHTEKFNTQDLMFVKPTLAEKRKGWGSGTVSKGSKSIKGQKREELMMNGTTTMGKRSRVEEDGLQSDSYSLSLFFLGLLLYWVSLPFIKGRRRLNNYFLLFQAWCFTSTSF